MSSDQHQLNEKLYTACENGDFEEVKRLLSLGGDVNYHNEDIWLKETPLHVSARGGHEDIVKLLLEQPSIDMDARGSYGYTPLQSCAYGGHPAVAKMLLDAGASLSSVDNSGDSPLHEAAYRGHLDIVKFLLQQRALRNKSGHTALDMVRERINAFGKDDKYDEIIKYLEAVERSGVIPPPGVTAPHDESEEEKKSKLKQLYTKFYQQLVEAVSDPDICHSLNTQLHSTSLLSEEKKAVLTSSLASGKSFLKVLGVEEEPHLVTVLMEKMSVVKQLQTLSEDMSGWLSGSKQGAADTQLAGKQERIERQQLVADTTSVKADLLYKLQHCEEDLKAANELLTMKEKAISGMMASARRRDADVEEREERISHLKKELEKLRRERVESSVTKAIEERTSLIEVLKPISTVESAVQANYLAVAPDFLHGVEVCGETVLEVVGDKPQKVEWPGYGFYIEVPDGALPPGVTASVGVKVILAGQFKLPKNRQLISAIYWVSSSEVFLEKVAVNIQHCAFIRSEEQCSDFRFIIAKCSQKELPYTFKEREGLFNSHTQYAAIKLKQFSLIGGTAPSETELRCTAFMYYKQQTDIPKNADFHFVLIKNLSPHIQEVKKYYQAECWKKDNTDLHICFEEGVIELNLAEKQEANPWEIVPLTTSQITKVNVTDFDEGRRIPHCQFECRLLTEEARIFHKVDILGATSQEFFYIRHSKGCYTEPRDLPPAEPVVGAAAPILPLADPLNEPPNMRELLRRVASRANDKWELIGLDLKIEQHQLNTISRAHPHNAISCYSEVFSVWQRKADPPFTWATIIDVLRSPIVKENALAQEIEDWLRVLR